MKCVLDSTFFFAECPASGELYTTPSVVCELVDLRSKCRYEILLSSGLSVQSPDEKSLGLVREAAVKSGDAPVLSQTDREVLALSQMLGATIYTDDFAIQNVAAGLGISVNPVQQRAAKKISWKYRCSGCGRYFKNDGECPVCGSIIKRKLK
ncbi:MAG: nucleotide-binding protein [Methanoregula sp.]